MHPTYPDNWIDIADMDDEELEWVERMREAEERRRRAEQAERRQLDAVEAARDQISPAPEDAYSSAYGRDRPSTKP